MKKFYNATKLISHETIAYPGDPLFSLETVAALEKGDIFSAQKIHMGNHLGTHIDFPSHVIPTAKTSSDYPLHYFVGEGLVIEIPDHVAIIQPHHFNKLPIFENDIIFFKTSNRKITNFSNTYVTIDFETASFLKERRVKIVGIDYLSIDPLVDVALTNHRFLLENDILIVENLELGHVPPGRYEIRIYPLQIKDIDGVPVTVSLESKF